MSGFKISNNNIEEMFRSAEKTAVIDEDVVDNDTIREENDSLSEETSANTSDQGNTVDIVNEVSPVINDNKVIPVVSGISKNTVNKIITLADNIDSLGDQGKSIISIMLVKKKLEDGENKDKITTVFELANTSRDNARHAKFFIDTINIEDRVDRVFQLLEFSNDDLSGVGHIISLLMGDEISGIDSKELTRNIESNMETFYQEFNEFFKEYSEIIKEIVNSLHNE